MNIPIWTGTSTFTPGQTPFGFYDNQLDFKTDADKVANFCARRLGYPLAEVELQSGSFYTAFEEAVTTYGNEMYAYKVRESYLSLEGSSTTTISNEKLIEPNFAGLIRLSEQYGEEAGVGGNVTWHTGSLPLKHMQQDYNMNAWAKENIPNLDNNDGIEIKRVFYEAPPAITRYFDPYAGTGTGMIDLMDSFGWGSYSPAINFLMMPLNYDLQVMQAIELNDQIRRSNYTFELVNNRLRVFPIPSVGGGYSNGSTGADCGNLIFEYIIKSERQNPYIDGYNKVTNVSEVPFENPNYNVINSIGRQWIFEYTLALCKEMLGYIRGKYSTIPIPDSSVTLNQSDLLSAATAEKGALIERLRAYLDETSRDKLLERRANENDFLQKELNKVPYTIYIA
jgi:hypothetical protein